MPESSRPTDAAPYPLVLTPIFKPKVWGGRALERFGKALPESQDGMTTFGESWELADMPFTSPTGGGGGEARSVIFNGPMGGKTLHDAMRLWGRELLGDAKPDEHDGFPLLVKYLDAREHLSVQAHPSPAYAAASGAENRGGAGGGAGGAAGGAGGGEVRGVSLKTESWVVLEAEPGAELFLGVKPGVTVDELRERIEHGTLPEVLVRVPAQVGACYTLPSGTIHALGAGIVVAEVQTPSDTTYRLYDWMDEYARPKRELHIEEGLAACVLDAPPEPGVLECEPGKSARGVVAKTPYYTIERVIASCEEVALPTDKCCVVMVTKTMGAAITSGGASSTGLFDEVMLAAGQTVVVPAGCKAVLRAGPRTESLIVSLV